MIHAAEFEGTYRSGADGKTVERLYVIKKTGDDQYQVNTNDWMAVVFLDKQEQIYKGVFRFKDFPAVEGNEFTKGGSKENAVGFQLYKLLPDGSVKLTFQWGRSARDGQGTYKLVRVSP